MDGHMQMSYEHCLPRKEGDSDAKKSIIVFRHGLTATVLSDTGVPVHSSIPITINNPPDANDVAADGRSNFVTEAPPPVHLNVNRAEGGEPPVTMVVGRATGKVYFGHPMSDIVEGKRLYTRKCLCQSGAHR